VVGVAHINMETFCSQIIMGQILRPLIYGGPQNLTIYVYIYIYIYIYIYEFSHIAIDVKNKFMCEIWNK